MLLGQRDTGSVMKKLTSMFSFGFSVVATVLLTLGFAGAATKLDPVAAKAKEITTSDAGHVASLPCMPCSGGGDPVDRGSAGGELA